MDMESSSYEGVCDLIALTLKNMFTEWAPLFSTLVIRMKTHENHDSSFVVPSNYTCHLLS